MDKNSLETYKPQIMKYKIRPIQAKDNSKLKSIILEVLKEYECIGPGFASNDSELNDLFSAYQEKRHSYLVIVDQSDTPLGGGGIAPLQEGSKNTAELRKMYLSKNIRGLGFGKQLILRLLEEASNTFQFDTCYLETVPQMKEAIKLYEKLGFQKQKNRLGNTGHFSCGTCYLMKI